MIDCETVTTGESLQEVRVRTHTLRADMSVASGGADAGPDPHEYFDTALAACKNLTAVWYAKRNGIPLERVESHVERDDSKERQGAYTLRLRQVFHGPLTEEQRAKLHAAVARCPIHKLMTSTEVTIESLDAAAAAEVAT
ncbi:MAG: OsmC family peroxiredoxin [Myxococcales bacterium]|nr:MAG: OsmC family peroxiredoxin [Myxococcales bacterium]